MADAVDQARRAIQTRLNEIDDETRQIKQALIHLGDGRPNRSRAPRNSRPTGRRAPRGERQQQFLAAVKKKPGARGGEIAKEMGVPPSQAYSLARRLQQDGQIRKRGKGYAVTK
jgi:predicted Rossmann fold nucleotide-binding protein DprA/Smf involved in DNA uptake